MANTHDELLADLSKKAKERAEKYGTESIGSTNAEYGDFWKRQSIFTTEFWERN